MIPKYVGDYPCCINLNCPFIKLHLCSTKFFLNILIIFIEIMSHVNHFIQGDTMGDAVCSVCCAALVNCQTAAEIKARTGGGAPAAE